jgi:hypothetical protein
MVFRLPKVDDEATHFRIIITNEVRGVFVSVSVTDENNRPFSPCKLTPKCHPEIRKPSVINYKAAFRIPAKNLQAGLAQCTRFEDASDELVDRIVSAAFHAEDLNPAVLALIEEDMSTG